MAKNKKKKIEGGLLSRDISVGGVSVTQVAVFAKNLSVMLQSGMAISDALLTVQEGSTGKLKRVLGKVQTSVESGRSLADAMEEHKRVFSGLLVNATRAGEAAGSLVENLAHVADQLEKERELISKVRGALIYPMVVLVAAFILGMAVSFLVLPRIVPLFEGLRVDLPFTTRALISFSHFIEDHGIALFLGITGSVTGLVVLTRQKFMQPITHWITLHTPLVGRLVYQANLARFCRMLGVLLKSGVTIDEALNITQGTLGNIYFRLALRKVSKRVITGAKIAESLAEHPKLFPSLVTRMIQVGEESGKLEENLEYLGNFYEKEVDASTKALSTAIEPVLLILIGAIVGFLAISIITPIYEITGSVRLRPR